MPDVIAKRLPPVRAEFEVEHANMSRTVLGDISRPLPFWERLADTDGLRRLTIVLLLGVIWEAYARFADDPSAKARRNPHGDRPGGSARL